MLLSNNGLFAQTPNKIKWKEDLEIYKKSLEQKHIDLYNTVTKDEFENEWNKIYKNVETLNDFEIILKLMHLTRRVNDGHTSVSLRNIPIHRFPLEVKFIDDKWRVVKVSNEHSSLLKLSLVAIDDVPIQELSTKVSEVAQFVENEHSQIVRTGEYMNISELLYALHITKKEHQAVFTFLDTNNQKINANKNF